MSNPISRLACLTLMLLASSAHASQAERNDPAQSQERRAPRSAVRSRAAQRAPRQAERRAEAIAPAQSSPGRLGVELGATQDGAVRLADVPAGSPGYEGGLRAGDVVLAFEGQPVAGVDGLVAAVRARRASTQVQLRIRRTLSLELDPRKRTADGRFALGAYLTDDPEQLVVARLADTHPAAAAGMLVGDSIVALDGVEVRREVDLAARMRAIDSARRVEVVVERDVRVLLGAASPPAVELPRSPPTPLGALGGQRELLQQLESLRRELSDLRSEVQRLREQLRQRPTR